MRVGAVLKASPIPLTPLAFRTSFVGFNDVEDGFEQPYSITTRSWEKMEDSSAMIQASLNYSRQ
jgi:hypothetical protein